MPCISVGWKYGASSDAALHPLVSVEFGTGPLLVYKEPVEAHTSPRYALIIVLGDVCLISVYTASQSAADLALSGRSEVPSNQNLKVNVEYRMLIIRLC